MNFKKIMNSCITCVASAAAIINCFAGMLFAWDFAEKWWRGQDSNLCTLCGQIYSLLPLTTRPPLHEAFYERSR